MHEVENEKLGWREPRSDGNTDEKTVTTMPTMSPTTAVRALNTTPPAGMSIPNAASIALRRKATTTPSAMPTTDAMNPIANASTISAPSTCLRLAPMARSSAISRVRWVTMIWKVL